MYLGEVIKTERPFKRPHWEYWHIYKNNRIFYMAPAMIETTVGVESFRVLSIEDVLADDYIVKEEWYEGDFKKKYPNGVLCYVWNTTKAWAEKMIVLNFSKGETTPFETTHGIFKYAEPVTKEEAPTILDKEDL